MVALGSTSCSEADTGVSRTSRHNQIGLNSLKIRRVKVAVKIMLSSQ